MEFEATKRGDVASQHFSYKTVISFHCLKLQSQFDTRQGAKTMKVMIVQGHNKVPLASIAANDYLIVVRPLSGPRNEGALSLASAPMLMCSAWL